MDPSKVFCHNPNCPARGKLGRGNIGIHSLKKRRYICHVCGKTFRCSDSNWTKNAAKGLVSRALATKNASQNVPSVT